MSGDWIKMRGNLWDDPRVSRIVDMTESSEAAVIGALYWLWATADQHSADGILYGLTTRAIDRKTGVQGFGDALLAIGWLADHPDGVRVVNFEEHNGDSAKKRCQTAKRVAKHKAGNAEVTHPALPIEHECVSRALPREEKRREEKEKDPPKPPKGADFEPEGFAAFWKSWPKSTRKGGRDKCAGLWREKRLEGLASEILVHVEAMAASKDWTKEAGQYVPAPIVYLRSRAWSGADLDCQPDRAFEGAI